MTDYIREYKDVLGRDIKKGETVTWLEDDETPEQAIMRARAGRGQIEEVFEWSQDGDMGLGTDATNKSWIEDGRARPCEYGIYPFNFEDLQDIVVVPEDF